MSTRANQNDVVMWVMNCEATLMLIISTEKLSSLKSGKRELISPSRDSQR